MFKIKRLSIISALTGALLLGGCKGSDGRVDVLGTAAVGAVSGGIAGLLGGAIARDQQGQVERQQANQSQYLTQPHW